ncbi:MAG: nucleoside monophosphate kinase [Verrucomicrobiota bacterium]|nr:nucleoside monophosphate kinase [Verrucomicrobiota bacterium]
MKRRVVMLGPPGCGKGTIATKLENHFGLKHISSGHWLRREVQSGSEFGREIQEFLDHGQLVPDRLVLAALEHWLTKAVLQQGYILDGFPRTRAQAVAFDTLCLEYALPLELVLYCSCPDEVILDRITGRRVCPSCGRTYHVRHFPPRFSGKCDVCHTFLEQRSDDTESVVRDRLKIYKQETEPLVEFYQSQGKLVLLDAVAGTSTAIGQGINALMS